MREALLIVIGLLVPPVVVYVVAVYFPRLAQVFEAFAKLFLVAMIVFVLVLIAPYAYKQFGHGGSGGGSSRSGDAHDDYLDRLRK